MTDATLRIGRIAYLNVWPLYTSLPEVFPEGAGVTYVPGHPSELNAALNRGEIDMAPASAFAYLAAPERFRLLPDLSICSATGPIQSVLLVSPVPLPELPAHLKRTGDPVLLSGASASSNALLKVLWRHAWKFPEPRFTTVPPGTGLATGKPFVEIGDAALAYYLSPPAGWHCIDLGQAWFDYTGTTFVFALWIVREGLAGKRLETLRKVHAALLGIKAGLRERLPAMVGSRAKPEWIAARDLLTYLTIVDYDFGPSEQASLILFAEHCRELGLISAVPGLAFAV